MAVTITDIYNDIASDRSRRLSITSGTSLADIMAAVETVLTTAPGGWTVHDASAGTNAKCYKELQKDGTSYTYMVLDWNTTISTGIAGLCIRLYETWNETTHAGTNKAENTKDRNNGTIAEYLQGQKLPYGETDPWQLDVHVLPGGAAFYASRRTDQVTANSAFLGSMTYGGATVVGECLRENPNTLPSGVPSSVWLNSGHLCITGSVFRVSMCRIFDARASTYSGCLYPGLNCISYYTCGYNSDKNNRPNGVGGRQYVSSVVPVVSSVAFSDFSYDNCEIGAIRGVLCVGKGNSHDSVWQVACDADYLVAVGGTNRNFRCYVGSGGPMCLLLPL